MTTCFLFHDVRLFASGMAFHFSRLPAHVDTISLKDPTSTRMRLMHCFHPMLLLLLPVIISFVSWWGSTPDIRLWQIMSAWILEDMEESTLLFALLANFREFTLLSQIRRHCWLNHRDFFWILETSKYMRHPTIRDLLILAWCRTTRIHAVALRSYQSETAINVALSCDRSLHEPYRQHLEWLSHDPFQYVRNWFEPFQTFVERTVTRPQCMQSRHMIAQDSYNIPKLYFSANLHSSDSKLLKWWEFWGPMQMEIQNIEIAKQDEVAQFAAVISQTTERMHCEVVRHPYFQRAQVRQ